MENQKSDTDRQRELEELAKRYYIFMDTNAVIDAEKTAFWQRMEPALKEAGKKVIIPAACAAELESVARDENKVDAPLALEAINTVNELIDEEIAVLKGTKAEIDDGFADKVILAQFMQHGMRNELMLITNDLGLAKDIVAMNTLNSSSGYRNRVMSIIPESGYLTSHIFWKAKESLEQDQRVAAEELQKQLNLDEGSCKAEDNAASQAPDLDTIQIQVPKGRGKYTCNVNFESDGPVVTACKLCGKVVDVTNSLDGYCNDCLHKGVDYTCANCGAPMFFSNFSKFIKHKSSNKYCADCKDLPAEELTCRDCGRKFAISFGWKDSLEKKHRNLPTRCPECHEKARAARNAEN